MWRGVYAHQHADLNRTSQGLGCAQLVEPGYDLGLDAHKHQSYKSPDLDWHVYPVRHVSDGWSFASFGCAMCTSLGVGAPSESDGRGRWSHGCAVSVSLGGASLSESDGLSRCCRCYAVSASVGGAALGESDGLSRCCRWYAVSVSVGVGAPSESDGWSRLSLICTYGAGHVYFQVI